MNLQAGTPIIILPERNDDGKIVHAKHNDLTGSTGFIDDPVFFDLPKGLINVRLGQARLPMPDYRVRVIRGSK